MGPGRPSEIEKQPSQVEIMPWEELPHCSEQTALHSVASHTQGVVGGGGMLCRQECRAELKGGRRAFKGKSMQAQGAKTCYKW